MSVLELFFMSVLTSLQVNIQSDLLNETMCQSLSYSSCQSSSVFKSIFSQTFWMRQCVSPWVILQVNPHQSSSQNSVRPFEWDNVSVPELFHMSVLVSIQVNIQSDLLNETLSHSSGQSKSRPQVDRPSISPQVSLILHLKS